jgi:hypothetical protein
MYVCNYIHIYIHIKPAPEGETVKNADKVHTFSKIKNVDVVVTLLVIVVERKKRGSKKTM